MCAELQLESANEEFPSTLSFLRLHNALLSLSAASVAHRPAR